MEIRAAPVPRAPSAKDDSARFAQHADEHRPQRSVLLTVDQQLGEGSALRVAPELADPIDALGVGEHQDVEQLGAGSRLPPTSSSSDDISSLAAYRNIGHPILRGVGGAFVAATDTIGRRRSSASLTRTARTTSDLEGNLRA